MDMNLLKMNKLNSNKVIIHNFFIGIKIVDKASHHHRDPKLILITWDRDINKVQQQDFGWRTKCDSENKIFLQIPIKHLFCRSQIPTTLKDHTHIKIK